MPKRFDGKWDFTCPECQGTVLYDPDDPMHMTKGAMLKTGKPVQPLIIYLRCPKGHLRRYEVADP
jgi:hypothetical protein